MRSFNSIRRFAVLAAFAVAACSVGALPSTAAAANSTTAATESANNAAAFDIKKAVRAAGTLMPGGKMEFRVAYISAGLGKEDAAKALAIGFADAAKNKGTLAIVGPDSKLNLAVIRIALHGQPANWLDGANVLYIGPKEQAQEISLLLATAGATFKSTPYPKD